MSKLTLASILTALTWLSGLTFVLALLPVEATRAQSADSAAFIAEHPVIRYAADPDFAPLDFIDNGRHRGLAKDYLDLIAKGSGLSFSRQKYPSWAAALDAFKRGEVDMLSGAFVSPRREQFALFSDPYFRLDGAILTLGGGAAIGTVEQLVGQSVGLVEGVVWRELLGEEATRIDLRDYDDLQAALKALTNGEIAALITDPVTSGYQASRLGFAKDVVITGQLSVQAPLAIAVRSDWPQLQAIVNEHLAAVTVAQENELRERWVRPVGEPQAEIAEATFPESLRPRVLAQLEQLAESDSEQRAVLNEALQLEDQADTLIARIARYQAQSETDPTPAPNADDQLRRFLLWRASLPERASSAELQSMLDTERAALVGAQQRRDEAALRLRDLNQRQLSLPTETEVAAQQSATEQRRDPSTPAQALFNQARQRLDLVQVASLQDEIQRNPQRSARAAADLRNARQQVARLRQRIAALNELQRARVVREAQARLGEMVQARVAYADGASEPARIAESNVELAQQLVDYAERYAQAVPDQADQARRAERVAASLDLTQQRLQLNAGSAGLGKVLDAELSNLDPPRQARRQLNQTLEVLGSLRLQQIDLVKQREQISSEVMLSMVAAGESDPGGQLSVEWQRREQLSRQSELIDELLGLTERLQNSLENITRDLQRRHRDSTELQTLIGERLLWLPTQSVLALDWLQRIPEGVADLSKPSRWRYTARLLWADVKEHPLSGGLIIITLCALWLLRRRAKPALEQLSEHSNSRYETSMGPTTRALLISLFAAAFWPLFVLLLGLHLQQLGTPGKFTDSLGLALIGVSAPLAKFVCVGWLTIDRGLASHFTWHKERYLALHWLINRLLWLALPVVLIARLHGHRASELGTETMTRPLLLLMCSAFAWLTWTAMRPGGGLSLVPQQGQRGGWFQRHAHWPIPLALLVFAVLQATGYSRVSFLLFSATFQTLFLVFALLVVRQLVLRWLVIQERKLARNRRLIQLETERLEREQAGLGTSDAPPSVEPEEVTVASIGGQTRALLRAALITVGGIGIFWVWSDLLPALQVLDTIELWRFDGNGEQSAHFVSLRLLLVSLVAITLTIIASRNLPGLLEIGLLQHVPIDAGARYAVTSVCRYLIVVGGVVYAASLLGIRWSQLQWMAAALTVGLGFGLQEVFANFVSGLILLFERPFRVGDTITVDNLSGTVTRIRTRATTILDWDNKEIVVPNKTFITGQLVNWTLSDSVTRVTVAVGTAYGSDPDHVLQVLRDVGSEHPRVLSEPQPTSWLMSFGDSSINFELRVYVAEIRDRLPVSTELGSAIHRRFREMGIEIPFPQVDVHMRAPKSADSS